MVTKDTIMESYLFLRKNNMSIPDETLDFIKDSALEKLEEQNLSKIFYQKHGHFPTVYIERNGKRLMQQRRTKEELLAHLSGKYPDWQIVESNIST